MVTTQNQVVMPASFLCNWPPGLLRAKCLGPTATSVLPLCGAGACVCGRAHVYVCQCVCM